ncbi:MAG TPA: MFS transporter [Methylomirabilota bacterium]|nr:MFS transporter [Methylomirabilota bacterium]
MKKPSLLVVFLTVFIDLVGFGIVLPLLPIYSQNFGASGLMIGIIMASFSAMQFLFAPVWGRLSDRIGRRPVLLVSTAGAALSYAVFALGSLLSGTAALSVLLVSRLLAGVCGANITVAQAYIADVTPPDQRSRKMGLIGMAFGLGFIFGPILGGVAVKSFGATGPGFVASALCAGNFLLALARLPESLRPGGTPAGHRPRVAQWLHVLRRPTVGFLIIVFFLATFCFACFETTLGLLVGANFGLDLDPRGGLDAGTITALFAFCGIVGALVQGGPVGRLVKRLGEPKLIAMSLVLVAVSLALIPFIHGTGALSWGVLFRSEGRSWWWLLMALALLAIGSGLTRPPLFGMLSILTPAHEQGETIGVAQSAGSLARIAGPLFAGGLFNLHPSWPYVACAVVALGTAVAAWVVLLRSEAELMAAKAHPGPTA